MKKTLFFVCTLVLCIYSVFANDYDKAWEALHRNDRKKAAEYLQKALKDPACATDAYVTLVYLHTFEGNEKTGNDFTEKIIRPLKDANPYLYAMWFRQPVLGAYGKKEAASQVELLNTIFQNPGINGSVKAAAHYVKGSHHLSSNEFEKAMAEWGQVGSFIDWQFAGPFENLSGTGFYKDHGPLAHPEKTAVFSGVNKAPINWFNPASSNRDAWKFVNYHVPNNTAIIFAQSFIYSPDDKEIILNAGASGSLKVWLNDALVLSESKEQVTELDYYRASCKLNKGYNRVLVQLGYSNSTTANFIIRGTDANGNVINGLKEVSSYQPYVKASANSNPVEISHFAETYFRQKIKAQPANPVNYILLTQALLRNDKAFEARKTIETIVKKFPDNSLLRFEFIQCLLKDQNKTLLSQEIERLKEKDPECLLTYKLNIQQMLEEEKYEEAEDLYMKMIQLYRETGETVKTRIEILNARKKYDEAVKLVLDGYEKYPQNYSFVQMMFNVQKNSYKDIDKALGVYEKYLNENFSYALLKQLGQEYMEQGKREKGLECWKRLLAMFPYDTELLTDMARYYYQQQDYKTASKYCDTVLTIAPFVANYWNNHAVISEQDAQMDAALTSYRKTLVFDPNKYETRKKLRELGKKKDLYKQFPETDVYELIKKSAGREVSKDYGFSYLLDEKQVIAYGEGGVEEYVTLVIKINTEAGIDKWKESYIPYNSYSQTLLIEKAEVVKKNGGKHQAEKDGSDIVFTSLEAGDAIVIKYRLQNYSSGRLSADFWDRFVLSSFQPSGIVRYSLLIDQSLPLKYEMTNTDLKPVIRDVDEFKMYTWQVNDLSPVESEPYMPNLTDVSPALHISTVNSWDKIVEWYSDLSHYRIEDEYELREVYDSIFANTKNLAPLKKAEKIYNYIQQNIRYSHISFRQGAYIPQRPSVTLNTRLGDCKDLSSLFVSLATMAGLKANMVLVDTKDNGLKEMTLPSLEFNHCIVLLQVDGQQLYLELTDNELPFASLPYNVPGAMSLIIPTYNVEPAKGALQPVAAVGRTSDRVLRKGTIGFDGSDLKMDVDIVKTAALSSDLRANYKNLSEEKQKEKLQGAISGSFKNPLSISKVNFNGLESAVDSVSYSYSFVVKNELIEVGDMSMVRIPFGDVVATLDNFSKEKRVFPLEYWRYEDADTYETSITINAPAGKKLIEIPRSESFQFGSSTYSIEFIADGDTKLQVKRKARMNRQDIGVGDYAGFKEFFNKIIKVESKYIAFK
ncbi:DUF3857 domain-containing protein [Terrimonas sp. NA20]|uniref:DUF3857 domain-containing protein n=1 Tax=Terrimonas ginsenosidimutans TaxID=2908004 RepID=A0ABS9KM69_9BACT|nr:DUF3857 domain-containing protein [Terrimonas ginsenosidimutans]MCG2613415.1 DUF3857 domain-containing protein [Terrimonas ginsenosidimutans]